MRNRLITVTQIDDRWEPGQTLSIELQLNRFQSTVWRISPDEAQVLISLLQQQLVAAAPVDICTLAAQQFPDLHTEPLWQGGIPGSVGHPDSLVLTFSLGTFVVFVDPDEDEDDAFVIGWYPESNEDDWEFLDLDLVVSVRVPHDARQVCGILADLMTDPGGDWTDAQRTVWVGRRMGNMAIGEFRSLNPGVMA